VRLRRGLPLAAAFALTAAFVTAAPAEGPGRYKVTGTHARDKSSYQATVTLNRTGTMTWQIVEVVGNDTIEGFGVGDGKTIAAAFASDDGSASVALYVANADGSYTGIRTNDDGQEVSTETLKPE
jgi:hypothetical protein